MVVITLSTVGYREVSPLSDAGKLVTIGVIGIGLASMTLLVASVTRLILEGELQAVIGKRRMKRDITSLSSHYIVCGYGRVGRVVCRELAKAEAAFVVGKHEPGGSVAYNPAPTDTIEAGAMLIVLGRRSDLDRFADEMSAG